MSKMRNKFIRMYLKYIVKSWKCFFAYLAIFTVLFLSMTSWIQLEDRREYKAVAYKEEIILEEITSTNTMDNIVYVYTDKDDRMEKFLIRSKRILKGEMHLYLQNPQEIFEGNVKIEIVSGKSSLLSSILRGGR